MLKKCTKCLTTPCHFAIIRVQQRKATKGDNMKNYNNLDGQLLSAKQVKMILAIVIIIIVVLEQKEAIEFVTNVIANY